MEPDPPLHKCCSGVFWEQELVVCVLHRQKKNKNLEYCQGTEDTTSPDCPAQSLQGVPYPVHGPGPHVSLPKPSPALACSHPTSPGRCLMPGAVLVSPAALLLDGEWDRPWLPDSTLTDPKEPSPAPEPWGDPGPCRTPGSTERLQQSPAWDLSRTILK